MAYGAKGLARHDGKVYFIADAVVGDVIEGQIIEDHGRYADVSVSRMIEASPLRGPAICSYAGDCGGCQWMGIAYSEQLGWKQGFVVSALSRIGKLPDGFTVEMIGSPAVEGYRNRILIRLHHKADGSLNVGYFRRQSRELVPITACAIAAPAINNLIHKIRALSLSHLGAFTVRIEIQEIPSSGRGELLATIYPGDGSRDDIKRFADLVSGLPGVHWAGLVFDLRHAPKVHFETDLARDFSTKPGQFQQVNLPLNHTLRRLVSDYVEAARPRRILDVFCGSGNLSLPLADGDRYVEGVEANGDAIAVAKHNASANQLKNVVYLAGDAEKHLWKVSRGGEQFDLVILDPPRQGFHKGVVPLKNLGPQSIIYVSCDPTTLARDLAYLCRGDDYAVKRVVALDFFPNTYHVETVVFLEKTSAQ
jgi:23S rRNA (uracil1939-C5)-methyltransferase